MFRIVWYTDKVYRQDELLSVYRPESRKFEYLYLPLYFKSTLKL